MIYLDSHDTTFVTVNGTTSTEFEFVNNQTQQKYTMNLWPVIYDYCQPRGRRDCSFMLKWFSTPEQIDEFFTQSYFDAHDDMYNAEAFREIFKQEKTAKIEGFNFIYCPAGEYNFDLGGVKGIMKLVDKSDPTTYENNTNNIVYNG